MMRPRPTCAEPTLSMSSSPPVRPTRSAGSGRAPDPDVGFQPCSFYEPQHAIDGDLLQTPRENARDGASGKAGVRGQLRMREASSIDLPQDSRDELCLEDCLEAAAFRDAEELGQAVGKCLLGHCVISFRRLRARSMWRRGVVCVVFLKARWTCTVPPPTSA